MIREKCQSKKNRKLSFIRIFLLILMVVSFGLALILGAEKISLAALFRKGTYVENIILWRLRMPRACLVLLTGILLGGSGAVFQLFFRNPLAEPGIMGISSGATLGAVIATLITGGIFSSLEISSKLFLIPPINLFAFLGAVGSGILVTLLAFKCRNSSSSVMLLLCGTALGTLYSSISSILLLICNKELHSIFSWILGSFNGRGWNEFIFILPFAIAFLVITFIISPSLDLLSTGEKSAATLGVNIGKLRVLVLVSGALAVSASVCAGGTIGFVGLIAPHIIRKFFGPKAKNLIPFSMIFGGILLLLSDILARTIIAPGELPAGVITSILGVPFFITLCLSGTSAGRK